jgi:hypothetical protein
MFRKFALVLLFLAVGSMAAFAANFNGKWTAQVEMPKGTQALSFEFHVDNSTLTGKITTPRREFGITDGKVDGDTITFSQVMKRKNGSATMVYTGKADGDTIKFSRQVGQRPATEFVAHPVK